MIYVYFSFWRLNHDSLRELREVRYSLRQCSESLNINKTTLQQLALGNPVSLKPSHINAITQAVENLRNRSSLKNVALLLPRSAARRFRYAAMNQSGQWRLFDTNQPPMWDETRWEWWSSRVSNTPNSPGVALTDNFIPVPKDKAAPNRTLYQRHMESGLWIKTHVPSEAHPIPDSKIDERPLPWTAQIRDELLPYFTSTAEPLR